MCRLAIVSLLLVPHAFGQTAGQKKATVAYLASLQDKHGAFRADAKASSPSLRATLAAMRAIRYFGGKVPDAAGCKAFVAKCQAKGGGFADAPGGKPDAILTAIGLMAGVETGLFARGAEEAAASLAFMDAHARTFEQVRMMAAGREALGAGLPRGSKALEGLREGQNADGTWGKGKGQARDTGSHAAAVLRLGGKVEKEAVAKALDAGQRGDGGFGTAGKDGSDLETAYRVVRAYRMLGRKPAKADALRAFIARCRNKDGGYGKAPGAPSSVAGTYYAGIILHWLGA